MELTFINVVDRNGRTSALGIGGRDGIDDLNVVGVLPHGTYIKPKSVHDAELLIQYLNHYITTQENGSAE